MEVTQLQLDLSKLLMKELIAIEGKILINIQGSINECRFRIVGSHREEGLVEGG